MLFPKIQLEGSECFARKNSTTVKIFTHCEAGFPDRKRHNFDVLKGLCEIEKRNSVCKLQVCYRMRGIELIWQRHKESIEPMRAS